jgi:hypothetical protein
VRTPSQSAWNDRRRAGIRLRDGWIADPHSYYPIREARESALEASNRQPEETIVKTATFIVSLSLALSGAAMAQQSTGVQGSASGDARATAAADKEGANVSTSGDGAASAKTDHASAAVGQGTELNATLSKSVDARNAKPGDEITATANEDMKSDGRVLIKRGSKLVGHVTTARALGTEKKAAEGSTSSQLGIVFDRAVLKNGTTVPLSATVQALAAAEANAGIAGAGSAAGSARSSGGGLVGGVAGGASGAIGGVAGRTGSIANGTVSSSSAALVRSAGAVGGLNAAGEFTSGSKGAFGLKGIDVSPATGSDAQGSIVSSSTQNVRLDRGTRMLLVNGGAAGAATVLGSQSRATAPSESTEAAREPADRR